jgi:geranylgeranyl diphosphate synthase type I
MILETLGRRKTQLQGFLTEWFRGTAASYAAVGRWGGDTAERLLEFAERGKMIRGALAVQTGVEFGAEASSLVPVGAAIELFQSGFLIHDDIMDRDTIRRGAPSVFEQFRLQGMADGVTEPAHYGNSMGICVGDIGFFAAFDILNGAPFSDEVRSRLVGTCTRELTYVGIAQMQDVYLGSSPNGAGEEAVLAMYRYKTARYTFSLPLLLGATAAGAAEQALPYLERIGDDMGIVFQIVDDEIGLFGEESEIGKPAASDLAAGKKTLYYIGLAERGTDADRARLLGMEGKHPVNDGDREWARGRLQELGVLEHVSTLKERYSTSAAEEIESAPGLPDGVRHMLRELLQYNSSRRT